MKINMLAIVACSAIALAASSASAAPVVTAVSVDLATPYTFTYQGSAFTFGFNGNFFAGPVTVSTANGGQVNTVLGQPTTNFTDRNTVTFGPNQQYAAFANTTPISFTNGDNFIGLRATLANGDAFYGFAYTSNNVLNSFGFETLANTAITATTAMPVAAVPEPASWAMMIGGFGLMGGVFRRRRVAARVTFA